MTGITQNVLARALVLCNPGPAEEKRITAVAQEAKKLVEQQSKTMKEVRDIIFGGSFAKGTWLHGDADIDIFVKIDPLVDEDKFERMGVEIGKKALSRYSPKLRYSDHPYVEAVIRGTRINIVPCYDVEKGSWKSAADRSPFHTQFITERLDQSRKEQVRLLKRFMKSVGVYGAEISIGGFSGYVSEVLIARYGSLENTLVAASEFKQGQIISISEYDKDIAKTFSSPLVIVDPIDLRRNLGTAVSPECIGTFTLASRAFLRKPSVKFFTKQKPKINKKLYRNVLVVEFTHRERSPDTIWGQLKRSANSVAKQLEIAGFTVFRTTCNTDEKRSGTFAFLLESLELPEYMMRKGPEISRAKDTESFVRAASPLVMWSDKEMRVSTIIKRKVIDARQLVKMLVDRPEANGIARDMITERVKIYSGSKRRLSGLVKEAADELVSTESHIFK